jgi:hypothetical protein
LLLSQPDFLIGNLVLAEEVVFEGGEGTLQNGFFYFLHQPGNKPQVMYGG